MQNVNVYKENVVWIIDSVPGSSPEMLNRFPWNLMLDVYTHCNHCVAWRSNLNLSSATPHLQRFIAPKTRRKHIKQIKALSDFFETLFDGVNI
jgi:hypothetical protein